MARDVIEVAPLVAKPTSSTSNQRHFLYQTFKVLGLIALWYFFSTTMSLLNKQFWIQFVISRALLDIGIVQRSVKHEETFSWEQYFRAVVPNGVSTGLDIGFSNLSLRTISLSFYTMCKSTTPLFLLLFAFAWKLEKPSCSLFGIMLVISSGICLLVYGETKFSPIGFSLVMTAACLAGLRWTLTQIFLQTENKEKKRPEDPSPLELLEKLTPIMSGIVLLVSIVFERWHRLGDSPYFEDLEQSLITMAMIVLLGGIAFLMVWTEFKVIQETSALTFMVAGTFKEIVTVLAAVAFFHDHFGAINGLGLAVLLLGVSLFNVYKYKKINPAPKATKHSSDPSSKPPEDGNTELVCMADVEEQDRYV